MTDCCNKDCNQGRDCPKRGFVEYRTGFDRLDNVLNAIAYGATLVFFISLTLAIAWMLWGLQ